MTTRTVIMDFALPVGSRPTAIDGPRQRTATIGADLRTRGRRYGAAVPELPEVETIRRQLAARVPGHRVVAASAHPSPKFADATEVVGARMEAVERRGKYLLLPTDDDRELIIHLGMTGVLSVERPAAPDDRWRRASWVLDDGSTLALDDQRRFGRVAVVPRDDHRSLPTLAALGPEPLEAGFTPAGLHRALAGGGQVVKTRLLGQRVVAGVGNIYADEALWRAGINPAARRIGPARAAALHAALVAVLAEAVAHGGTRLRDYRTLDGDTGAHQWHLDCYGRAGRPCNRCGTTLRRRVLDGRSTTWCPACQAR
jgi:formamidopyrimidine-DNA glycosylase